MLYNFFVDLGCTSLGINIEEQLGVHCVIPNRDDLVKQFWEELFVCWTKQPAIRIRDFERILPGLNALSNGEETKVPELYDIFPSISWNGDVVLLAPEFLNVNPQFVVGNVLTDSLEEIISRGEKADYVTGFVNGIHQCKSKCEYFQICYGGQAGNKFFEHGTTNVTETAFCRHSEKMPVEAILQQLEKIPA